jgi:hypothetical protein
VAPWSPFTLLFTILAFEGAGGRSIDLDVSGSETSATTAMLSMEPRLSSLCR